MATVILGAVGAGIELAATHGARWQEGWAVGTIIGGIFEGVGKKQDAGKLDDLRVGGSSYGASIPKLWGKNKVSGNVIWVANYRNNTELVPSTQYLVLTVSSGAAMGATSLDVFANVDDGIIPAAIYFTDKGHAVNVTVDAVLSFGSVTLTCSALEDAIVPDEVFSTTAAVTHLVEHRKKSQSGGGSGGITNNGEDQFWYSASYAVAFCEGTFFCQDGTFIDNNLVIKRLWANDILVYDVDNPSGNKLNIRFYYGQETQTPDVLIAQAEAGGVYANAPAFRGLCYTVIEGQDLTNFGSTLPTIKAEIWSNPVSLGDICGQIFHQVNLTTSDYDVSDATAPVTGYLISNRITGQDSITNLIGFYTHDITEFDLKIKILSRGKTPTLTVNTLDLGAKLEGSFSSVPYVTLTRTRKVRSELPGRLDVIYSDVTKNFDQDMQSDIKQTAEFDNPNAITVPLSLYPGEARQGAARLNDTAFLELDDFVFSLPISYQWLTETDTVYLEDEGITYVVRITQIDQAEPGELTFTCVEDNGDIQSQSIPGSSGSGGGATTQTNSVPVMFGAWSNFALQDSDKERPGFYVWGDWPSNGVGGTVFYSPDGGTTVIQGPTLPQRTCFGKTTSGLASSAGPNSPEVGSSLDMKLVNDGGLFTLGTTTLDAVLSGDNVALVGEEVLGFIASSTVDMFDYTVSNLIRQMIGSLSPGISSGDRFVVLNNSIQYVQVNSSYVGVALDVKVLAPGQVWSDVTAISVIVATPTKSTNTKAIDDINTTIATIETELADHETRITALEAGGGGGGAWDYPNFFETCSLPAITGNPATGFASAHMTTGSSATVVNNAIVMYGAVSTGESYNMLAKNKPATPYFVTICMGINALFPFQYPMAGLYWRDSVTGVIRSFQVTQGSASVIELHVGTRDMLNPTTFVGVADSIFFVDLNKVWLRIGEDVTNFYGAISNDGINFVTIYSGTKPFTPDQVGIFCQPLNASYGVNATFYEWLES